ncbi:hypothetical protein HELRODRAFT_168685 [Helobdella robusta]|uniref:Uncharacterized protein n=1 Tax=Helobdella robusta TaxID=6412 RepID=T1F0U9_HELRO|nr:hypothetical protein HELRODRAFT_168685 [Helobdella robusta]ESO08779.1 hypothetical protein HELRODRAFT_168685 [Helobdella robusta]
MNDRNQANNNPDMDNNANRENNFDDSTIDDNNAKNSSSKVTDNDTTTKNHNSSSDSNTIFKIKRSEISPSSTQSRVAFKPGVFMPNSTKTPRFVPKYKIGPKNVISIFADSAFSDRPENISCSSKNSETEFVKSPNRLPRTPFTTQRNKNDQPKNKSEQIDISIQKPVFGYRNQEIHYKRDALLDRLCPCIESNGAKTAVILMVLMLCFGVIAICIGVGVHFAVIYGMNPQMVVPSNINFIPEIQHVNHSSSSSSRSNHSISKKVTNITPITESHDNYNISTTTATTTTTTATTTTTTTTTTSSSTSISHVTTTEATSEATKNAVNTTTSTTNNNNNNDTDNNNN